MLRQFCFHPKGHGSYTFCAVAETEAEARDRVNQHIEAKYRDPVMGLDYAVNGWGTDYYYVESHALDQVVEHEND